MLKLRLAGYESAPIAIYLVDGKYVRDNLYIDFTEGGNDMIYGGGPLSKADFIPQGEVWLDFDVNSAEMDFVLLHELTERRLMQGGMDYEKAHEGANQAEQAARVAPDTVDAAIAEVLSQQKEALIPEVKTMPNKMFTTLTVAVKAVEGQSRVLEFIGSTEAEDRDGEIIRAEGWVLDNYLKNPIVLWAHRYDQPPIGRCVGVKIDSGKLVFQVEFADIETYAFADTIYRLCKGGFISATSVGFVPIEWEDGDEGRIFTSQELLELSIVPIPSNPEALVSARAAGVITHKEFRVMKQSSEVKVEETEDYFRVPVAKEEGKHKDCKIRTIDISEKDGIKALYCIDDKVNITYLFDKKHDWTMEKAKQWVKDHSKRVSQAEVKDELDYLVALLQDGNLNEENMVMAKQVSDVIKRITGNDMSENDTKALTNRHKEMVKEAMDACKGAMDTMDEHHKVHNKAHKDHKDLLVKAHDALSGMVMPPEPDDQDEQEPDEDDKGIDLMAILTRARELQKN